MVETYVTQFEPLNSLLWILTFLLDFSDTLFYSVIFLIYQLKPDCQLFPSVITVCTQSSHYLPWPVVPIVPNRLLPIAPILPQAP